MCSLQWIHWPVPCLWQKWKAEDQSRKARQTLGDWEEGFSTKQQEFISIPVDFEPTSLSLCLSLFSIFSLSSRPPVFFLLLVVGGQCSLLLCWPSSLIRSLDVTMETTRHYITSSRSFSECMSVSECVCVPMTVCMCVCVGAALCQNADEGFQFYSHWTAYIEGHLS